MNQNAINPSPHIRSITVDIIATVFTCGLFNLWVQAKQMAAVNEMLNAQKYKFWPWFFLTLLTCGIYHIFYEYKMCKDIGIVTGKENSTEATVTIILTAIGLSIVADLIQQTQINEYFEKTKK